MEFVDLLPAMITEYFKALLQAIDTREAILGLTSGIVIGLVIFYTGIAFIYRRINPIELQPPSEPEAKPDE